METFTLSKVHLGCHTNVLPGWINLDMIDYHHPDFYKWDLRNGLPDINRITHTVSEHFFEHLTFPEGQELLKDCHNRMVEGGVMSMALPNFRQLVERYLANDWAFFSHVMYAAPDGQMLQIINDSLYQWVDGVAEHKTVYDVEYAIFALEKAGFKDCKEVAFNPEFNKPERQKYTFYVEGRR